MKIRQILTNKRIQLVLLAFLLILIVGLVILFNSKQKGSGDTNSEIQAEHDKGDLGAKDDKADNEEDNSPELEVLEPNEVAPENTSDVSGSWGDAHEFNTHTNDTNSSDNTDKTESENKSEESKGDEDILEDDISWGTIY